MRDDVSEAVRYITTTVVGRLSDEIAEQTSKLETERAFLVSSVRAEAQRGVSENESRMTEVVSAAVRKLDESAKLAADTVITRWVEGTRKVTAECQVHLQETADQQVERVELATQKLGQAIESADKREREAVAAMAKLEIERAAHNKAQGEAEAEKVAAQKATALLALAGDVEIQRMVTETQFRETEKRTLAELKAKRAEIEDGFDLKSAEIQRGVQHYYPELQKELDRLTGDQGSSPDDPEEKE